MVTEAQRQGLGTFVNFEFTLEHDGAMAIFLLHEDQLVARFSQLGATEQSLQKECANHLAMEHHWDGVLWSGKERRCP